jgi:carbon monoxide dehydrogenase subunit G
MKMSGEERIEVPRGRVWEALNDPKVLQQCIPGCLSLEKEAADRLRAIVEVKVGPIGARFNAVITLTDIDPLRSYRLTVEGQGGTVGSAKSNIRVQLAEDSNGTLLSYEVDATVGGRLAQLGGPLIDATAKQLAGKFFKRLGETILEPRETASNASGPESTPALPAGVSMRAAPSPAAASVSPGSSRHPAAAWLLAIPVAALTGFLVGRGQSAGGSDWMGLAIGLLILIVAAASFEFGRRTAVVQIVLDAALLQRLLNGGKP